LKLPNADAAVVDIAKLRDYCLNDAHPVGKHKAIVFKSALGFTASDAELVRDSLIDAVSILECMLGVVDEYGKRYTVDVILAGPAGSATVRSGWIIRAGEDFPRLTTCYVL
jgi:hypothetical protein